MEGIGLVNVFLSSLEIALGSVWYQLRMSARHKTMIALDSISLV